MDEYMVLVNRVGSDTDTGEGDTTSRNFWDASHQPHRPTAPRAQNEDEDKLIRQACTPTGPDSAEPGPVGTSCASR